MEDMILRIEVLMTVTSHGLGAARGGTEGIPGYVLIKMVMTDDTWHLVRNVRGVTGFVVAKTSLSRRRKFLAMGMEKHEIVVRYANVGDHVKIVDGPLASFTGVVEVEPEKNRVSVMVSCSAADSGGGWSWTRSRSRRSNICRKARGAGRRTFRRKSGRAELPRQRRPRATTFIDLGRCYSVAQKIAGYVKLQIPQARQLPRPVGPALGQHGVNIAAFTKSSTGVPRTTWA